MGGWAATPPGPTDQVEVFNYITSSWHTHKLKLPVKRAYHGLILRGSQVGEFLFFLYRHFIRNYSLKISFSSGIVGYGTFWC
jgi:hypothetical protein